MSHKGSYGDGNIGAVGGYDVGQLQLLAALLSGMISSTAATTTVAQKPKRKKRMITPGSHGLNKLTPVVREVGWFICQCITHIPGLRDQIKSTCVEGEGEDEQVYTTATNLMHCVSVYVKYFNLASHKEFLEIDDNLAYAVGIGALDSLGKHIFARNKVPYPDGTNGIAGYLKRGREDGVANYSSKLSHMMLARSKRAAF
jgi:hypothetical protein